jgi:pimeloyl-ACP methyl ester carboxylesterase
MPYAVNEGVRIYYETEGQGTPLVLGHGGSDSLEMWRRCGYTDALRDDFQLVLFDFRGHGRSDKPREVSAYGTGLADDIVAVLDDLGIPKAHYLGYSMGALAGYMLATRHAERFHSFILGGMTPYQWPEAMVTAVNVVIDDYTTRLTDPGAYLQRMERLLGHSLTPEEKDELLARDAGASIAVLKALPGGPGLTDQDMTGIRVPCLVYCGELDPFHAGAKESAEHMPRAAFVSIAGLDHVTAFLRSDLIVPYVKSFITVVSG